MNVNIYIETSFRGPATKRAAGAWIVEYISSTGRPVTRGGILYADRTTENELALQLVIKAFSILTKTCCARVFTECGHVLRTMKNHWIAQWEKNGWINAKGKLVRDAGTWKRCARLIEQHMTEWTDGEHEYRQCMQNRLKKELKLEHGSGIYEEIPVPEWNTQTRERKEKEYV
ncbi:MAG: hypothetical protein NC548_33325 [Lachnospiraceae bacterium]|nr:hypothetical protein [Lachnospiraceae bacterium]